MSLLRKVDERFSIVNSLMWAAKTTKPAMEVVYRELFLRDLSRLGLEDLYYPVGSAANHSLLYLIARSFIELPIRNALEMGAGQSSILLSQLNERLKKEATITTVEHDPLWAERIQSQVTHRVNVAPLVPKSINGHNIYHYGGEYFDPAVLYDFVLVDGPPAHGKEDMALNRLGALELFRKNLAENFVIIVDDAERRGEDMLVGAIRQQLKGDGRDFKEAAIMAAKQQHIFAAGRFLGAVFF
jgi:predicted O-methyltransferase YrrM